MKLNNPALSALLGFTAAKALRGLSSTWDIRVAYYDRRADPAHPESRQSLLLFWHEYILLPVTFRAHCGITMLVSSHRDAQPLARAGRMMGFQVVCGSSTRDGVAAVKSLLDDPRHRHIAITPDGPRGPRRYLAPGAVYLASKLGIPVVCVGFGFERPWRMNSWDRFAVPRPFSRGRAILSPPMMIPAEVDRAGREHYRGRLESLLSTLTDQAEQWAATGQSMVGELPGLISRFPRRGLQATLAAGGLELSRRAA